MPNKFISSDPFGIAVYHTSVKVAGLRVRDMVEGGAMAWGRVPGGDCSWLPAAKDLFLGSKGTTTRYQHCGWGSNTDHPAGFVEVFLFESHACK